MTNDFFTKPRSTLWQIIGTWRVSEPGQHWAKAACTVTLWGGGKRQLFPDKPPRQLQTLVDTLPLQSGLTIVEAPTGSGKTDWHWPTRQSC